MLIKLIEDVLNKPRKKSKRKLSPAFKPSIIGSPCHRKIYYSYNRVEEDYDADLQLKKYGKIGTYAHDRISEFLRESGVLIDYVDKNGKELIRFGQVSKEFPIKDPTLEISAQIDAVLEIDGKLWLGEYKTIGNFPFKNLKEPKKDHLMQACSYVPLFEKALNDGKFSHIKRLDKFKEVEGVIVLYENRENGHMKEFLFTKKDSFPVFKEAVKKIQSVKSHVKSNTLPGKTPDWCKSCPWRLKCSKNYKI